MTTLNRFIFQYLLWLVLTPIAPSSIHSQNCPFEAEIIKGVECNLPKIIATNQLLLPCVDPFELNKLPVGTKLMIDFKPGSCFSICLQGDPVEILCATFNTSVNNFLGDLSVSLYPQPAKDILYFSKKLNGSFVIYNLNGVMVIKIPEGIHEQADISGLTPGFYFLRSETNEGTSVAKFIKL